MNTFAPGLGGVLGGGGIQPAGPMMGAPPVPPPGSGGAGIPGIHVVPGINMQSGCDMIEHVCMIICCCGTNGLLSKFPSRAKRIDVISRFIFPLIFAIFNLAYWLYYLLAKSMSPQLEG